jgi:hypothetical protein
MTAMRTLTSTSDEEAKPLMTDGAVLQPEKMGFRSNDIAADKVADLPRLFPEVHTEGRKIDFGRLKFALGGSVDIGKERYGMNWPVKTDGESTTKVSKDTKVDPIFSQRR